MNLQSSSLMVSCWVLSSLSLGGCGEAVRSAAPSSITWSDDIQAGMTYAKAFGPDLVFLLEPTPFGWTICVLDGSRDITALTPPLHGPNPRYIEGWHFRNEANSGANVGELNVPQERRDFIFSPAVGTTIQGPQSTASPTPHDIETISQWGRGVLVIDRYQLTDLSLEQKAHFVSMHVTITLTWPSVR